MIERNYYVQKLFQWKEREVIKVLSGIRRCGKSTVFSLYIEALKKSGVSDEQIIHINLEDMANASLLTAQSLNSYIEQHLCKNKWTYVFLDEIQQCVEFEKAINSLHLKEKVDIYITGSNAYFLSGELATLLSGRYITIHVFPLSFKEYLQFTRSKESSTELSTETLKQDFNDYVRFGSFPYVPSLNKNQDEINTYLEGVYSTILLKDVAQREKINDISVLQ